LLFENYGQKVGDQYIVSPANLKVGGTMQSPPVTTVVAPMIQRTLGQCSWDVGYYLLYTGYV